MNTNTDVPSSSFSPPPFRKLTYDVFLSFRGKDTRNNFTDHLYAALKQKGIFTFRDDEKLERGESLAPNLLTAIEESRYVIVILSRNYANSTWCLDEIAKIVECMKGLGQTVLPVFYDVDPSDVRKQTGEHFGKAFSKHQKDFEGNPKKVQSWRDALFEVGNLSGWHLQDGSEAKVVQDIVEKIFTQLNRIISISEGLVGMDSHLNEMLSYLDIGCPKVRIIGICGMGGIGKTTIAQVVFKRVQALFEGCSFLENVREVIEKQGVVHLQKQLLSNLLKCDVNIDNTITGKNIVSQRLRTKMVLIILDDVDEEEQLEALFDLEALCDRKWFGPGSRIIITSRDEHLLSAVEGDKVYKVNPLTDAEALQLFSMKAFKKDQLVGEEILKLSKEFLKYANGLPLAIKVLGSSVKGRSVKLWSSALERLQKSPDKKIINVLRVSFDGLESREKKIFLDIACFFKGESIDRVRRVLQGSDAHCPDYDLQVLLDKSMVTLFGKKLWMHDLIQELGWEVVRQESPEPKQRSRLWLPNEIMPVFNPSQEKSAVQSILLLHATDDDVVPSFIDAFSNMDKLRLLMLRNVKFSGNLKHLSNELQYLEWHEYHLNSFPSDFQPDYLVELHMYSSLITHLWRGRKGWNMLRVINLRGSRYLMSTPDFTEVTDLEVLMLQDCINLTEVHPSLGLLKKLMYLDMRNCKSIESIPPFTSLESLKTLNLSLCSRLKKFLEIEGNMKTLLELRLDGTSIEELPPSVVERLTGLTMLNLEGCKNLLHLPSAIQCLTSLKCLILTGCSKLDEIPKNLNFVEELHVGGTAIRELSFLVGMKNLQYLFCQGCKNLVPEPCRLRHDPDQTSLFSPDSFSSLTSLVELDMSDCNLMDGAIPNNLGGLISLRYLNLSGNNFVRLPESISQLSKLETLDLKNCKLLQLVPKLPLDVHYVNTQNCTSLVDFSNELRVLTSNEWGVTAVNSSSSSALGDSPETRTVWTTPTAQVPACKMSFLMRSDEHTEWKNFPHWVVPILKLLNKASRMDFTNELGVLTSNEWGVNDVNSSSSSAIGDSPEMRTVWTTPSAEVPRKMSFSMRSDEHTEWKNYHHSVVPMSKLLKKVELLSSSDSSKLMVLCDNEIPEWFSTGSTCSNSISIRIPQNLTDDNKWEGVAVCAVFSVKGSRMAALSFTEPDPEFSSYFYRCTVGTDVVQLKPCVVDGKEQLYPFRSTSHLLLIFYVPSLHFPKWRLNQSSVLMARFETNNPLREVQKCGIRLVYEQDAGWYSKIFPGYSLFCLNEDKAAILECGWFSIVDNGLIWEKFIPPCEQDSTVLVRKNIESVLHRYLEALNQYYALYQFNLSGFPAWFEYWFDNTDTRPWSNASIENLHKNKKWMGFAICASIAGDRRHMTQDNCPVYLQLNMGDLSLELEYVMFKSSEQNPQLFVVYIPRALIPEAFMQTSPTEMDIFFRTCTPHVEVQSIGFRVVYQDNLQGLVGTIIRCMQREDTDLEIHDKWVVQKWIDLIKMQVHLERICTPKQRDSSTRRARTYELLCQKYRNWDWSASPFECVFLGAEIRYTLEYMHFNEGNTAEIQLPTNLVDDANWLGVAVCAFLWESHEDPNIILESTPDSEFNVLYCCLDSDIDWDGLYDNRLQKRFRKLGPWDFAVDLTYFYYLPRNKYFKLWNNLARVTFSSSSPCLGLHGCSLRLVFKEDVEHLVQTLTLCELP